MTFKRRVQKSKIRPKELNTKYVKITNRKPNIVEVLGLTERRIRCYEKDGFIMPGVTTFLTETTDNTFFLNWRKENDGKPTPEGEVDARQRGTDLHALIEKRLLGETVIIQSHVAPYWESCREFVDSVKSEWWGIELPVWSEVLSIGGRVDLVTQNERGNLTIIDWKSSSKPKYKSGIQDYFIQSAVYANLLPQTYPDLPPVDEVIIAIISPKKLQLYPLGTEEIDWYIDEFFNGRYLDFFKWVKFQDD